MTGDWRIAFGRTGGTDVLAHEDARVPPPGAGEVTIRHSAVGLNFIDVYHRNGLYPVDLPSGLGTEAAGTITAVGTGVEGLQVGERVAYAGGPLGAYSTARTMPADLLVHLPDAISDETAAAVMLKGLTADYLIGACAQVRPGQSALVLAASGGVGSLLVQWLSAKGVRVIAHAGTAEKAARAQASGAIAALHNGFDALAEAVRGATDGHGVDVAFDGVGKASWNATLASMAPRGLIVSYGNASGAVPAVEPGTLQRAGSLFLTRPTLADYVTTPDERRAAAMRLFDAIADGTLRVEIGQRFALADAVAAHQALESRATIGSTVLVP